MQKESKNRTIRTLIENSEGKVDWIDETDTACYPKFPKYRGIKGFNPLSGEEQYLEEIEQEIEELLADSINIISLSELKRLKKLKLKKLKGLNPISEEQQDIKEIEQEIEGLLADGINITNLNEIRKLMADGVRIKVVKYNHSDFIPKEVQKPEPVVLTKGQKNLFKALSARDIKAVKKILDSGVDVDTKDEDGKTPLISASSCNHAEMVKLLLERNATINPEITLVKNDGEDLKDMEVIRLLTTKYIQGGYCDFNSNIFSDTEDELVFNLSFEELKELLDQDVKIDT